MSFELAILSAIGVGLLGGALVGVETLAKWFSKPEVLPPPDRSARRLHVEEWEQPE